MVGSCNWQDPKDIERWMDAWREEAEHKGLSFVGQHDPIEEIRHRFNRGDFAGKNKSSVEAFLKAADAKAYRWSDEGKVGREERAIAAAERSAKWAGWAILLSIAALAVAAWPYMREWFD